MNTVKKNTPLPIKKVALLAFGAHPDDVELACSGTLLKHISLGYSVGIIDLTQGELGSRGSAELRLVEAQNSAKLQGVEVRENLNLGDGFFEETQETLLKIVAVIRKYQPAVIFCNAPSDRHPDHGRGSELVSRACFLAGLLKIETTHNKEKQLPHRPQAVYHYIQDRYLKPDFIVDITPFWNTKMKAILSFSSQFHNANSEEPPTPISSPEFLDFVQARAIEMGRTINAKYGEGFITERTIGVEDVMKLL